jgi:hypothetical protein
VEGSDLCLPQREKGTKLCMYVDYFFDFFSEDIKVYITEQSSILVKVILLDASMILFQMRSVTVLMGIIKLPSYRDYWSNDFRYAMIVDVVPLKKYEQFRRFLHYEHNT